MGLFAYGAVPFFISASLIATAIEFVILKLSRKDFEHDPRETRVTYQLFAAQSAINFFLRTATGAVFMFVYDYRLFTFEYSWWVLFPFALILSEFCYYWMHRYTHRVRLGWMSHIVHHIPKAYNASINLRTSLTSELTLNGLFFLPMALVGFPPRLTVICILINQVYGFYIHTRLNVSLGWVDKFLVTPGQHRVHHETATECLDKNFGTIFNTFDKIFGTFEPENPKRVPIYGVLEPADGGSFFESAFIGWRDYIRDCRRYPGFLVKAKLLLCPPGWTPEPATEEKAQKAEGF